MASEPAATLLPKDYIALEIDVDRETHGAEVIECLGGKEKGLPWLAILDAQGKTLATSEASGGNIGSPYKDEEIAHFVAMLQASRVNLTDADHEALRASLVAVRLADEAKKKAAAGLIPGSR
jgi:hypothetical protein